MRAHRSVAGIIAVFTAFVTIADDVVDLENLEAKDGFVDLYWDAAAGRMLLKVEDFDTPFIYQSSLPRGIGSNDIGLDRGQLGDTKIVRFVQSGPKVLLVEDNLQYRADSDNADERNAITESFARSVIWGFTDLDDAPDVAVVDATAFFVRDAHGVASRLSDGGEGSFDVDESRSAIFMPRTKVFPDNTEVEAIVTFIGEASGPYLPTVTPDSTAVTVHVHHSFIRLPDNGYEPLPYDPRGGVIGLRYDDGGFLDYASAIGDDLIRDYGRRHRLKKKDPTASMSEAIEPIVYYLGSWCAGTGAFRVVDWCTVVGSGV